MLASYLRALARASQSFCLQVTYECTTIARVRNTRECLSMYIRNTNLSASEQCKHVSWAYVCSHERIRLHRFNLFSGLLVKPSIDFTKLMKQNSSRCRKIYFPRGQARAAVSVYCLKSRDYKRGNRLWRLPWTKSVLLEVVASINSLVCIVMVRA